MAGRHIKALLAAHRDRDDLAFRRAAQAIIDEEESKRHTVLAQDLRRLLVGGSHDRFLVQDQPLPDPPLDHDSAAPLLDILIPDRALGDLVLSDSLAADLRSLTDEVGTWQVLDAMGVPRRNRVLLHGPPGCGKTSIATGLAGQLGRMLAVVRMDAVISSYLGETASNLRRVFEFAQSGAYVVLFDEFDSLGKNRDDPTDHGELRRVVNAILQLIDRYAGPSILVAATNHAEVLDEALWRRFDEVLNVELPSVLELSALMRRLLMGHWDSNVDIESAALALAGLPHAAAEFAAHGALRAAVAAGRKTVRQQDVTQGIDAVRKRRWR